MGKLDNIHDKFFKKIFSDTANVRTFLKLSLPEPVLKSIDTENIKIDSTEYITGEMKRYFSDIVIKTNIRGKGKKEQEEKRARVRAADIYILFEHKSYQSEKIHFQLLRYMYMMWAQDIKEGKRLRVIIPYVFYHGKGRWKIEREFKDIFDIDEELKKYILNYRYLLFDTNEWDFKGDENTELKNNIYILTS